MLTVTPAERLREVVALCGFTRLDGPDSGWPLTSREWSRSLPCLAIQPLGCRPPKPGARGFSSASTTGAQRLGRGVAGSEQTESLREAHQEWRRRRNLADVNVGWPGERYILLHTLSHALINELALECGYSAASIRERIYAREAPPTGRPWPGSFSTRRPRTQKARSAAWWLWPSPTSSPHPRGGAAPGPAVLVGSSLRRPPARRHRELLHAAACHCCGFLPETSCERGNRYLDRNVLVETLAEAGVEFPFGA